MFVITSFKMQENNFESIINTWRRRMSGEQVDSAALESMSGDSQGHSFNKKKEDEDPLMPDRKAGVGPGTVATASAAVSTSDLARETGDVPKPDEKQEFIEHDKDDDKEGKGDGHEHSKEDNEYLENKNGLEDSKWEKDKMGDNVDSVYLRPPPPHKVRSTTSNPEEEDCGLKCLYYTLQCCDCVLM